MLIENGLKRDRTLKNSEIEKGRERGAKDHTSPERIVQGHHALAFSRMVKSSLRVRILNLPHALFLPLPYTLLSE